MPELPNPNVPNFPTAAGPFRSTESVVLVDVGAKRVDANISRDGVPIGVLDIDTEVLNDVIIDRPFLSLRVVAQSVPAGTPVPLGTAVELVLASPFDLPVGIVTGTHVALRDMAIGEAFDRLVAGNPQVNRIVARAATGPLSAEDEQAIRNVFLAGDISVSEEPGQDVGAALESLRVLTAFGR
jgi:hypothetical protein